MGKTNFTKQYITSLVPPKEGRLTAYDSKVRGLGVLVQPSGYKAFFWFRKVRGYPYWKSLGRFPDLTVENARDAAEKSNVTLANWKARDYEGENPFLKQRAPTVGALIDLYIENQIKPYSSNPDRASKEHKNGTNLYWAKWKPLKLGFVTRKEIITWHRELGQKHGHVTANRQWEGLRTLFNWAIKKGIWRGENPARIIDKDDRFPERSRTRFLKKEEAPAFFAALREETNRDLRDFIIFALFTGARRGDVLGMRWDQISGVDWTVPNRKKPDRPYHVTLMPEVLTQLKERKQRVGDSPWVFPSHGKQGHLTSVKRGWKEFLKRAKLRDLHVHDLRRTLASWQAQQGTSLLIIGESLGHRDPRSTQVYARLQTQASEQSVKQATRAMLTAGKESE